MNDKQHVQLPNKEIIDEITTQDQLVYVSIKRHQNKETKEAFPSIKKLQEHTGMSKNKISKCINNLEKAGWLIVKRENGKPNVYKFPKYDHFESFSFDFLDNPNLTSLEKQYILSTQQYMYLHSESKTGITSYSNKELSDLTGMSLSSINRCNKSLQQNHCLDIIKNHTKDLGCNKNTKVFHLDEIGNEIVFTLLDHEDRITNNEKALYLLQNQISDLTKLLNQVIAENRELKKSRLEEPRYIQL